MDSITISNRQRAEKAAKMAIEGSIFNPLYVSTVEDQPPINYEEDTGTPYGAYPLSSGGVQMVFWDSDQWNDIGDPLARTTDIFEVAGFEFRTTSTFLQVRVEGGDWVDVIALEELKGEDGVSGEDGKDPEFRVEENVLEWKLEDDPDWIALIDFTELEFDLTIVDNLTSTNSTAALSANMGRELDQKKVDKDDVKDNLASENAEEVLSANQGRILNINKSDKRIERINVAFTAQEPREIEQQDEDKILIGQNEGMFLFEEDTYEPFSVFVITKDTQDDVTIEFESEIETIPNEDWADGITVSEYNLILVYFIEQNVAWVIASGLETPFEQDIQDLQTRVGTLESNEYKHRGGITFTSDFTLANNHLGRVIRIDTSSNDVVCTIPQDLSTRALTTFFHAGDNDFSFDGDGVFIEGGTLSQGEGLSMSLAIYDEDHIMLSGGIPDES